MSQTTFRAASLVDVPRIVGLVESAYRGESGRHGWTTESDLLDGQRTDPTEVTELVDRPRSRVVLAERMEDHVILGCCHVEQKGDACHFGLFSVSPMLQSRGVGTGLLGEGERIARVEWSCREMRLSVIDIRVELIRWYERRGYERTGIVQPFPYGDERCGVPRRLDLRFEVLIKDLRPAS